MQIGVQKTSLNIKFTLYIEGSRNNKKYMSETQKTNYTAIIGVIVLILNHFNVNIGSDEIMALIGGVLAVYGIVANWYHRYQKGDITFAGTYK